MTQEPLFFNEASQPVSAPTQQVPQQAPQAKPAQPEKPKVPVSAHNLEQYYRIGRMYQRTFDRIEITDPESELNGQTVRFDDGEKAFRKACRKWYKADCVAKGVPMEHSQSIDRLPNVSTLVELDDNMQRLIRDVYIDAYDDQIELVESGQGRGTVAALDAVYERIINGNVVYKDVRPFLPNKSAFNRLRFTPVTQESEVLAERFARARVNLTVAASIKRSLDDTARKANRQAFVEAGEALRDHIDRLHVEHQSNYIDSELLAQGYREL